MENKHPLENFFSLKHPISSSLTFKFLGVDDHMLSVAVEAPECFVTDPKSGQVHSGFSALVLDTAFGAAVMDEIERMQPIATIGLTTQHMRRAIKGEKLVCRARFEGVHEDVAHVSGQLVTAETGEILATATGTFMVGTRSKPLGVRL